jgi:hypothetical protein
METKKEIYQRDYSKGMSAPVEMVQTQSEVKETKKNLITRIQKINNDLKAKLVQNISILSMCIILAFSLASCNKQPYDPTPPTEQQQTVTQYFGLTTVKQSDIISKNYNPQTFTIAYSDVQYMLTISNQQNTYHKLCSVNELRAGTIAVTMIVGTYNVDYQPILDNDQPYTSTLNVAIHMQGIAFDGSPKILQGTLMQSLIIMDLGGISSISNMQNADLPFIHKMPEDFWYAYTHKPFAGRIYNNLGTRVAEVTIDPLALGKLYWVIPSMGITYQLDIPELQTIQVPVTIQ